METETTLNALTNLLEKSDHDPDCPLVGDKEATECPCGYAEARVIAQKVASHLARAIQ